MKKFFHFLLCQILVISCSSIMQGEEEFIFHDSPINESYLNVLKRAAQFGQIEWTPLLDMPRNTGFYYSGKRVKGLPYSSVKELDKFIGLEVSLRTFMTAVNNPRSVLYSENVGDAPYHGMNCSSYYGVVCSSVIDYALGLSINYTTSSIDTLSFFEKAGIQSPDAISLCDVLWIPGHEVMVFDIARNAIDGTISFVTLFESGAIPGTIIRQYSYEDFERRWYSDGFVIYRYNRFNETIPYEPCPFIPLNGERIIESYRFNNAICTSRGDYVVYREGEDVVINVLDRSFVNLELYQNDRLIEKRSIIHTDEYYTNLGCGSYTVKATTDSGRVSEEVHFDVVDISVSLVDMQDQLRVLFRSKYGKPVYLKLCDKFGSPVIIRGLSDSDIDRGTVTIPIPDERTKSCYCKVYFSTPNGMVTNLPIKIKSK